jgi:hypothetical protein
MEIELPDGTILEAPDDADPSAVAKAYLSKQSQPAAPKPSLFERFIGTKEQWTSPEAWKRAGGLAARVPIDAATSIPLAAADAGIAARNMISGALQPKQLSDLIAPQPTNQYRSASDMYQEAMGQVFPTPTSGVEKGMNIAGQMVIGSKLPAPQAAQQAPANFNPATLRQMALAKGAEEGYVVPPSTVNPSATNRVLESIGGKVAMEQDASLRNQKVTDSLVKRALGVSQDEVLGPGTLESIRAQAGKVYADIGKTGNVKVDQRFVDEVAKLPKAIADEIAPRVKAQVDPSAGGAMRRGYEEMPASELMQKLRELRFESQRNLSALAAQNPESAKLGKAQKKAAEYVEELLMRHLRSNNAGKLADDFEGARKLIAQTHTVQKAMNEVTGEINAAKLAQQLAKGKPLTGDLRKVAEFSTAFPKASRLVLDSGPVRNTDVILGAGTAALSREPTYLLYPFARQMVRAGLLSNAGQKVTTIPGLQPSQDTAMSLLYGAKGLLGQ